MRRRRGSGIALVLLLVFSLFVLVASTLAVVAASAAAVERDYRGSQALALAEAGLAAGTAQVRRGAASPSAGTRDFAEGESRWRARRGGAGWRVEATGTVVSPRGLTLARTVRAELVRRHGRWEVTHWREERER
jgi:Tfp pilus assembly protein PilX